MTVAGRFASYDGALALTRTPAIELTIDADSLDTNHAVRDEHLRSAGSSTSRTIRMCGSCPTARP